MESYFRKAHPDVRTRNASALKVIVSEHEAHQTICRNGIPQLPPYKRRRHGFSGCGNATPRSTHYWHQSWANGNLEVKVLRLKKFVVVTGYLLMLPT